MVMCVVCSKSDKVGPKRSFHSFPSEPSLRQKWTDFAKSACNKSNITIDTNTRICSFHFHHSERYKYKTKWYIKDGACPSVISATEEKVDDGHTEDVVNEIVLDDAGLINQNQDQAVKVVEHPELEIKNDLAKDRFFNFQKITSSAKNLNYYTGLKDKNIFDSLFEFFIPAIEKVPNVEHDPKTLTPDPKDLSLKRGPKSKLSYQDQFLMTLIKLRLNLPDKLLGDLFGLSPSSVCKNINKWILVMSKTLQCTDIWASRNVINSEYPPKFEKYPGVRVIIDATEIQIEHSASATVQKETWSQYKHRNTVKGIIGISPQGQITFVSKLYGGRISDKKIVIDSKILDLCEAGDIVMADRGFTISEECEKRQLQLILPSFLGTERQFSDSQVKSSREIASLRFDVERLIGKVKNFKILHSIIPLCMSAIVEDIWFTCNYLANFTSNVTTKDESDENIGEMVPEVIIAPQCRRINWPNDLMSKFLSLAENNTTINIETIGLILAKLEGRSFTVSNLIIPKQTGTSDSCTALDGLDLSQFTNLGEILIGWIHTHPTQTCFMSSLDLHTQYQYQRQLKELVGVVCAPSYNENEIFSITEPYGMNYIAQCPVSDRLHDHSNVEEVLFTKASHVDLVELLNFNVHDWR